MNANSTSLKEVRRVEITTLIDNYVDLLLDSNDIVTRPPLAEGGKIFSDTLLAEHGLSLLVRVFDDQMGVQTILFDTGYSRDGVLHNVERLAINLDEIDTIIMSHGHMDHAGSLDGVLARLGRPVTVVCHPDAFAGSRFLGLPDGNRLEFPRLLDKETLIGESVQLLESQGPTLIAGNHILVTGQVERTTDFETGMVNALMERNGEILKDPIADDQALVIRLKDKGLVVIAGCSHAGIINTLLYARQISGTEKIHAVLGGFHLTDVPFEPVVRKTIRELLQMNPALVVPMHCTGRDAVNHFEKAFPDAFILNSVGSTYTLS
jgi:7,8-dihydropterin-6-yl-methyl-4-(beta-D-ribofuranosyl)aminobenzene 5'-phosphate synthase